MKQEKEPILSIITINRNNAKGLERTINSVIAQSFKDFEWIVIDGASTDESVNVIKRYADHCAYWISEKDTGIYNAMNKGIRMAHGEYVIFMNSGDCFADEMVIEEISDYLDGTCIVAGNAIEENSENMLCAPLSLLPRFILENNICHQAEFIKRSLFQEIGLYSEYYKVLSDMKFNLQAACKKVSYCSLSRVIAVIEQGGLSNRLLSVMQEEECQIKMECLSPGVDADYQVWMNRRTYAHQAIVWAINRNWPLKLLKGLYRLLG